MASLAGKWQLVSSENFDEYMKEIGVSWALRQMGNMAKPNLIITIEGKHYVIKSESTFKTTVLEFDLDTEFDETTADGREVKTNVTLDASNKLIQHQKGKVDTTLTRYLEDNDTMVTICEANAVKSTRKYKRMVD